MTTKITHYLYHVIWILISLLILIRIKSILINSSSFFKTLEPIWQHPFATKAEKLTMKYPRYYPLMQEIKNTTPENTTIYLPEVNIPYGQPLWALGQMQMTQTLLYPRNVKKYLTGATDGYLVYYTDTTQGITKLK